MPRRPKAQWKKGRLLTCYFSEARRVWYKTAKESQNEEQKAETERETEKDKEGSLRI